jgi:hypothetical protein
VRWLIHGLGEVSIWHLGKTRCRIGARSKLRGAAPVLTHPSKGDYTRGAPAQRPAVPSAADGRSTAWRGRRAFVRVTGHAPLNPCAK